VLVYLEVPCNVAAVPQETGQQTGEKRVGYLRSVLYEVIGPKPVHYPDRYIHCACPIDAIAWSIGGDPVFDLSDDLGGIAGIASNAIGYAKCRQMLTAGQLPWNLDVGSTIRDCDLLVKTISVPFVAVNDVSMPWDEAVTLWD
jgi:hypothetical protein